MVREGLATQKGYLAREARLMADYDRGEMNIADYVALIQAPLAGIPKSDVDALVARPLFGTLGVWISMPIADTVAAIVTAIVLVKQFKQFKYGT